MHAFPVGWTSSSLPDEMECTLPARLVEDVDQDVGHEAEPLAHRLLVDLVSGRLKRPVDKHRPAYDVLARHKAPEPAVETFRSVVTHREDLTRWNHEVAVSEVIWHLILPASSYSVHRVRRDSRKIVAVGVVLVLRIAIGDRLSCVRLILSNAVQVHDAVFQMQMIAWQ